MSWETFTSKEGKFSILMPISPSFTKAQHKSFIGMIEENTFRTKSNSETFSIEYSDLPRSAFILASAETILDETREGFLNNGRGIQLQFTPITFQGNPGRLLIFKTLPPDSPVEMIGKAYFYLVNQRLYVLVGTAPRAALSNNTDRFLSSFKLL